MTRLIAALICITFAAGHALADQAQRIVIAGGDLAEIAFALGAGDRVIAVDSTATYPAEASEKEQIGYVRRLSAEGVLSLTPDLLIAAHDAGPPLALDQIMAAGVPVLTGPALEGADAVAAKIRFMGAALELTGPAEALAAKTEADLAAAAEKVAKLDGAPKVLFILSLDQGTALVGGRATSADAMIALAGGTNAAAAIDGYKPMGREAVIAAAPDVLLMMSQHAERFGGAEAVLDRPDFALTPAGEAKRAITMEGMLLLGFGPRTPAAIESLADALHKGAASQ